MIIGIDGNEANIQERVGVHQYSYELLWAIYRLKDEWRDLYKFVIYLKKDPIRDLPEEFDGWNYKIIPGEGLWIVKNLTPVLVKDKRLDIFFSPNHYLPIFLSIPRVCTIHDLGYLEFSQQFKFKDFWQLKIWTAISLYISKYIIAVSDFTKRDIVRHYPFTINKIAVAPHGYDSSRFNTKIDINDVRRVLKVYQIDKPYILFLSTLKPSKNIEGLLEAFAQIKENKYKFVLPKLVIAGKKGWLYQTIFEKVKRLCLEGDVIFTDFIKEEDKPALIKGAKVFISPSFWEGFGMHVLEAMACGVPVIVSHVASLPEVVGDAGIFVDPKDITSITNGIEKVLSMNELEYNMMVKRSLKQAEKFSWEKTARKTLSVFKKAASI